MRKEMGRPLDAKIPGSVEPWRRWSEHKQSLKLVSPANRHKHHIIVVGTGLAGAGAVSTLAELGFKVSAVTYHDSPRRAHSVAAQGGINAARGRRVDGDGLLRFVTDTIKGGDFRAREAEAWRLAEESSRVIDHLSAHGVPFAREYDGALSNRSFGGVQVSRTFYSRGQTGQQLQVAAHQSLLRQVAMKKVDLWVRHEMLDLLILEGRVAGVVIRDLNTGDLKVLTGDAVVLATGGYANVYRYSTLAKSSNASAIWRAHRRGAAIANTCYIQFHPTALPIQSEWQSKTTLMSESLRNDGRIWVPKNAGDERPANEIPQQDRDYFLERKYPSFGNLTPRDVASRAAREQIIQGRGVGPKKNAVNLDFSTAINNLGMQILNERYKNLFDMYFDATGEDPRKTPMRIAPGAHFTMGGLWVDYNLMSTIPGLFVAGEASHAYHGANRLGANSLLSACVDGFFVIPSVIPDYLASLTRTESAKALDAESRRVLNETTGRIATLIKSSGSTPASETHAALGELMYQYCAVSRSGEDLLEGIRKIDDLRRNYLPSLRVTGSEKALNQDLELALRVQDYLELAQTMCVDALHREESCGAHFREEYSFEGEAVRNDEEWMHTTAWLTAGWEGEPAFTERREPLSFEAVQPTTRSYK